MDLSQICSISDPATLSQMLIVPPDHCYWNRHYDSYRLSGHIWCITRKFKEKKYLCLDKKINIRNCISYIIQLFSLFIHLV